MVLDTNIVIYFFKSGGEWLSEWTHHSEAVVASVSRIEALGFLGIDEKEEAQLRVFSASTLCYDLDDEVIDRAIELRQAKRMKIGDSIIAATALEYGLPLVTRTSTTSNTSSVWK